MKKYFYLTIFLFISQMSVAQINIKRDFIICIDEKIVTSLINPTIIVKRDTSVLKEIEINYHAGEISLNSEDYNTILCELPNTIFLKFDYYQYSNKGKQNIYNYEIEMERNWFEQTFVILYLYNLDKKKYIKKYKKIFGHFSKEQEYILNIETSEGEIIRS